MYAAGLGHNDTTRYLIEHGADVNIIVHATPEYIVKVAEELKEGKEGVEPHKDGVTALMFAIGMGQRDIIELLFFKGILSINNVVLAIVISVDVYLNIIVDVENPTESVG